MQMLHILVYFKFGQLDPSPQYFGRYQRISYHNGEMDLPHLLDDHIGLRREGDAKTVFVAGNAYVQVVLTAVLTFSSFCVR
jgi:hypothetical protein